MYFFFVFVFCFFVFFLNGILNFYCGQKRAWAFRFVLFGSDSFIFWMIHFVKASDGSQSIYVWMVPSCLSGSWKFGHPTALCLEFTPTALCLDFYSKLFIFGCYSKFFIFGCYYKFFMFGCYSCIQIIYVACTTLFDLLFWGFINIYIYLKPKKMWT